MILIFQFVFAFLTVSLAGKLTFCFLTTDSRFFSLSFTAFITLVVFFLYLLSTPCHLHILFCEGLESQRKVVGLLILSVLSHFIFFNKLAAKIYPGIFSNTPLVLVYENDKLVQKCRYVHTKVYPMQGSRTNNLDLEYNGEPNIEA